MTHTRYKRAPSASTFKEQVALSGGWRNSKYINETYKNSRYETSNKWYQEHSKQPKKMIQIAKPKEGQFEKTVWSDKVYTGDNDKNTATLTYFARQREQK